MELFKFGHASALQWQEAAKSCLDQLGITLPANLGFLYVSDLLSSKLPEILDYFKQHTGISHWVGTVGIGICSLGREYFDTPAIAAMVGHFQEDSFKIFNAANQEQTKEFLHLWAPDQRPSLAVVHGDPRNGRIGELVSQLSDKLGGSFLVGGLTSSRGLYWQIAEGITEGGLSGVLFSNAIPVATRLTQGCSLIGIRHQITECYQNIIIQMDNRPALEVFKEDLGEKLSENLEKAVSQTLVALPIQGSDTGDYLVRNLVGIDYHHKLLAMGDTVYPGMSLMFARRNAHSAYKDLIKMLNALKSRIKKSPKGGIYYSCMGRGKNLFGKDSQELRIIQRVLGNFPLVGFFGYGEISNQYLYGYTGVLTLFL